MGKINQYQTAIKCEWCAYFLGCTAPRFILGMGSANERRRYDVTPPLIGRAHTQNDPSVLYYLSVLGVTTVLKMIKLIKMPMASESSLGNQKILLGPVNFNQTRQG